MNPLSAIYGAAGALRNQMFDRGILASRHLDRPVVSVGNLSVGGAGKTPFVVALGELLKARGIRFDVLSRGYGRKTRGVLEVDPNGSPSDFGDEPLLIARRLAMPVFIGESRYEAGCAAEKKFDSRLHILDDGFQHRSLARDFDIVLLSERDFDDQLLPSGRLREPLSSLGRADAIVLTAAAGNENSTDANALPPGKLLWRMKKEIIVSAAPDSPVVFCGIARPEQFFAQVCASGITPASEITFHDHHSYRPNDIERLLSACARLGAGGFVTTEKDAINLGPLKAELNPLAIAILTVTLENSASIMDSIVGRIRR